MSSKIVLNNVENLLAKRKIMMIDLSMKDLKSSDVRELSGLSLNIAYLIYAKNWKWFNFNGPVSCLLLDKPLEQNKLPDKDCAFYIGDDRWIFKNCPKYNENISLIFEEGIKIINYGYDFHFGYYLEEELGTSSHGSLIHASAEKRCRTILRLLLDYPTLRKRMNALS